MKKITIILFILILTLSACAGNAVSLAGEWTLISYGNASNPTLALPDAETSLTFGTDGQFGGNVGCNSLGAGYQVSGNQVTFEGVISTLMFCEETMYQESAVLKILSKKTLNIELNGNQLTLTSQDGSSVIVLEKK